MLIVDDAPSIAADEPVLAVDRANFSAEGTNVAAGLANDGLTGWPVIAVGDILLAKEKGLEGWHECEVLKIEGDLLTFVWSGFPDSEVFTRRVWQIGLLGGGEAMLSTDKGLDAPDAERGNMRTTKIRALNDTFRQNIPRLSDGSRLIVTDGVGSLPPEQIANILLAVRTFAEFNPDNDPHGEHDFGAIEHAGIRYFWKVDAYDRWMQFGSPDPSDPSVTTRVLTIMRADEY